MAAPAAVRNMSGAYANKLPVTSVHVLHTDVLSSFKQFDARNGMS